MFENMTSTELLDWATKRMTMAKKCRDEAKELEEVAQTFLADHETAHQELRKRRVTVPTFVMGSGHRWPRGGKPCF